MGSLYTVAIDVMGGDNAPLEIVKGALAAVRNNNTLKAVMVGDEKVITEIMGSQKHERIEIVHASEVITGDDVPTVAIKKKKDSSMIKGLTLVKEKKADAFISAGNTGALLTGATLIIGRQQGIERPALATLLPNAKGTFTLLLDSGANVDCKASYITSFGEMGSKYMQSVMGLANPRVGLVNVGTEEEKGNAATKEAFALLKESNINFCGNCEASQISTGAFDVVCADGFVGNVVLKHTEGLASSLLSIIKEELMADGLSKVGALLAKSAFKRVKKRFDYEEVGGAPFLGLNALVVKAHGSSKAKAIEGAFRQCLKYIDKNNDKN